jgi:hypothetical protein
MMSMGKVAVARRERLHRLCKSIVDDPASIDGDTKAALQSAAMKYASTLDDDPVQALEVLYHDQDGLGALVRKAVEVVADHDDASDDQAPVSDHHASKVADLLVEAGKYPHRAAALDHLLHSASGQALLARMHKAAEPAKEQPMTLENILKDFGPIKICKHICDVGKTGYSEFALVSALTKYAAEQHPELTEAQAFAKLYENASVWQAIAVAKAMPVQVSLEPLVVGGVDATHAAIDDTESSEAFAQLQALGQQLYPHLRADAAFEKVFTDPKHAALANRAHRRPAPTTSYAWPK